LHRTLCHAIHRLALGIGTCHQLLHARLLGVFAQQDRGGVCRFGVRLQNLALQGQALGIGAVQQRHRGARVLLHRLADGRVVGRFGRHRLLQALPGRRAALLGLGNNRGLASRPCHGTELARLPHPRELVQDIAHSDSTSARRSDTVPSSGWCASVSCSKKRPSAA
jgi:hypothetical protein